MFKSLQPTKQDVQGSCWFSFPCEAVSVSEFNFCDGLDEEFFKRQGLMLTWRCSSCSTSVFSAPWPCSVWCTAMWRARIALQMVMCYRKPDVYQGGFSLQYSQRLFLCIFQRFQQLDSTKFIFRTFHPWMKTTSCVTDVRREGGREGGSESWFVQQSFPGTVSTHRCLTTDGPGSQASQDGNNLVFFWLWA